MTKYTIELTIEVEVEIAQEVIDVVDDEWRATFYDLEDEEAIVAHIATNLLRRRRLFSLDGWADMPDEAARVLDIEFTEANLMRKGENS